MDAHGGEATQCPAEVRDQAGSQRDQAGDERDVVGEMRDEAGDQRDVAAAQRDEAAQRFEEQPSSARTSDALGDPALARRHAAGDRKRAWADRQAGASERTQAGVDRSTALADRDASAHDREHSAHDELTGAYVRRAGLIELDREIGRARRTDQSLALAFIDVDRLKATNDALGHAGGDRLLAEVATTIRTKLRSYDLVIRYGGDEFVCAIAGLPIGEAAARLSLVNSALAEGSERGSVTIGVAELLPSDTSADLIARADQELYRQRRRQRDVHA